MTFRQPVVVIGVGNRYRRDDGVGPAAIDEVEAAGVPGVEVIEQDGEPSRLIDAWDGVELAVVIDAVHTHSAPAGALHRLELGGEDLKTASIPAVPGQRTSHGLGPGEAVKLGAAVNRLPARLVVYGVEVEDVELGVGFTPAVAGAIPGLVERVLDEVRQRPLPEAAGG